MTFIGLTLSGCGWREKGGSPEGYQAYFDLMFRSCKLDEIESIEPLPGGAFVAVVRWSMAAIDGQMG